MFKIILITTTLATQSVPTIFNEVFTDKQLCENIVELKIEAINRFYKDSDTKVTGYCEEIK